MSKTLQAKLGMLTCAFVLLISLAAFFITNNSSAWLADNRNVSAGTMSVNVDKGLNISATLSSYGVVDINADQTAYTAASPVSGVREESYELPVLDPNGISYSKYKKALVVVVELVCQEDTRISVKATAENGSNLTEDLVAEQNYFSNCAAITPALFNDSTSVATKNGSTARFTTPADGSFDKVTELLLFEDTVAAGTSHIAFIIEYNSEYVSYATNYILNNDFDYFELIFNNDVSFVISRV